MTSTCLHELEILISIFEDKKGSSASTDLESFDQHGLHHLFNAYLTSGTKLLELRHWDEYRSSHVHGAIHVDVEHLSKANLPKHMFQSMMCYGSAGISSIETYRKLNTHCSEKELCRKFEFVGLGFDFNQFKAQYPFVCVSAEQEHVMRSTPKMRSRRFPNVIIPNELYLGNEWNRRNVDGLKALGITHIVDLTMDKFHDDNFQTLKIAIPDSIDSPIQQYLDDAVQFIANALEYSTNKVFVHCQMGVSRSSTIIIAYLIKERGCTLYEAYKWCKTQRPKVWPNDGFHNRLKQFEEKVHGKSTADLIKRDGFRKRPDFSKKNQKLHAFLGADFMMKVDAQI